MPKNAVFIVLFCSEITQNGEILCPNIRWGANSCPQFAYFKSRFLASTFTEGFHAHIHSGQLQSYPIHSKSKKVCGFYFSVSKNLRKKCVNRDDKILRQKCVNQSNVIRNASFENKNVKTNEEVCLFD